jgi:hypothetical protein
MRMWRANADDIVSISCMLWVVVKRQQTHKHLPESTGGLCRWCRWFCGWKGPMILEQQPPTLEALFTRRKYGRGGYLLPWRVVKEKRRDLSSCISGFSIDRILWVYCKKCKNWGPFPSIWLWLLYQPLRLRFNWKYASDKKHERFFDDFERPLTHYNIFVSTSAQRSGGSNFC